MTPMIVYVRQVSIHYENKIFNLNTIFSCAATHRLWNRYPSKYTG